MKLSHTLLPELDHEMATTRKLLERVPDDRLGWKPHDKSMSLGRLATHVAELPALAARVLTQDSHDINPPGGPGYQPKVAESHAEMVELFDANVRNVRELIESAEDDAMRQPWSLQAGGQAIFTLPRTAVLRTLFFNHLIHHRGQLSVYLRLNDVPVPAIYGPSADEGF